MRGSDRLIVAVGLDVDGTFPAFVARALKLGVRIEALNLRAAVEGDWRIPLPATEPAQFWYGSRTLSLHPADSYYCRVIDLASQQTEPGLGRRWMALTQALRAWLDTAPGKVANRTRAGAHNGAKPLHEAILGGMGFSLPDSLTSCDLDELAEFAAGGPTVSKALCGARAHTEVATSASLAGFDPRGGPVHLQRRVDGDDARIHVAGDELVAQRAPASGGVDYRRDGGFAGLEVFEPPADICEAVIAGSKELGLDFAGWDFRISPDGRYWCLEVNPMPGYGAYDVRCDGAITRILLRHLGARI
jgi:hypothetical protein